MVLSTALYHVDPGDKHSVRLYVAGCFSFNNPHTSTKIVCV